MATSKDEEVNAGRLIGRRAQKSGAGSLGRKELAEKLGGGLSEVQVALYSASKFWREVHKTSGFQRDGKYLLGEPSTVPDNPPWKAAFGRG